MRKAIAALVFIAPTLGAQAPLPLKYKAKPTSAAISAADLMSRLYVYADDSMMGRETGTKGHLMSTAYIAAEVQRFGLKPGGDNGTFFQTVPAFTRTLNVEKSSITVDGMTLKAGVDFINQGSRPLVRKIDGATVIYGGMFGDTAGMPSAEMLAGKIVVLSVRENAGGGFGRGGGGGGGFGGGQAFQQMLNGAAAIVRIGGAELPANLVHPNPTAGMTLGATPSLPAPTEGPVTLVVTEHAAETLLGMPVSMAKSGTMGKTIHGTLVFDEKQMPARNVVAILRGSDPKLRETYVAMGAHNDHVGMLTSNNPPDHDSLHLYNAARYAITGMIPRGQRPTPEQAAEVQAIRINMDSVHKLRPARLDSVRNGADDDGSGTVTLLEIAEQFAKSPTKPKRSIVFVWHVGEEKGLWGSRWYTDHTTVPKDSIIAQLNMDMVGRGEKTDLPVGSPTYLQLVGSKRLSTELGALVEDQNAKEKMPFTIDYQFDANGHPENIYCRSDHFHYARIGIPVVFFTTGLHGDYHQVTDEPQYINYDHMARIGQFVYDIAVRLGYSDKRPVVDGVKMDPMGVCRQ
ncbi:MAG TPA: M20/M25/M40 family metallo-hydrolase [Gemmatimonadaceae bacterium]